MQAFLRQLREPWPHRGVVAQRVEPLERPGEDVLKDILRIGLGKPEGAHRDRVDVAREALDELVPGRGLAGSAALNELGIRELDSHPQPAKLPRFRTEGKKTPVPRVSGS